MKTNALSLYTKKKNGETKFSNQEMQNTQENQLCIIFFRCQQTNNFPESLLRGLPRTEQNLIQQGESRKGGRDASRGEIVVVTTITSENSVSAPRPTVTTPCLLLLVLTRPSLRWAPRRGLALCSDKRSRPVLTIFRGHENYHFLSFYSFSILVQRVIIER